LRLFPRFSEGDLAITDPDEFVGKPTMQYFYPNYLSLACSPFTGIDVHIEYWVPESQAIAGRVRIRNTRLTARELRFEWAALLSVAKDGERMAAQEIDAATVLCGKTDGLAPVLFMSGGGHFGSGPYPSLANDIELPVGGERSFTWILATLEHHEDSFQLAKQIAQRTWDSEIARLHVLNAGLIDIETGDANWDAAFALSQKAALGLFVGPTDNLPANSFVLSRQPNHGYSASGSGNDYAHLWSGQSPIEADYLASLLLPTAPELIHGLLQNFLETQKQSGFVDWKPGLGGQRGSSMATPLLANIAWKIFQATENLDFLESIYPQLLGFVHAWFDDGQDRDGDGIPEWSHLMQSGLDDHPTFSQWQPWTQGADISFFESPAICAMLYNEIQILLRIANTIEQKEAIPPLEALKENIISALDTSWDETNSLYRWWDRETHFSPQQEVLGERQGPGEIYLRREFSHPVRVLITIKGVDTAPRQANIFIHGASSTDRNIVERLPKNQSSWRLNRTKITSERVYASLESIEVANVGPNDTIQVEIVGLTHQDYSLFLPLWAGIPSQERADKIIQESLLNSARFWRPFGLPLCPTVNADEALSCQLTSAIWDSLIGLGLLKYGYRDAAAELVNRLMSAIVMNLINHGAFAQSYHADNGQGAGERNAIQGLAPVSLFLEVLGVRLISPNKVFLEGQNPFPWPVTINYRGLTIFREKNRTKITFPGGQTAIIKNPQPRIVTLDDDH
jgi:hypothetical protein